MMDYFTQLAARSLAQAPVLRPRLPSRFEPVEPAASPWENVPETPAAPRLPAGTESFNSNTSNQEPAARSTAHPVSPPSGRRHPPDISGATIEPDTVTRGLLPREPSEGAGHPGARRPEPPPAPAVPATINDAAASFIVAEHSIAPRHDVPPKPGATSPAPSPQADKPAPTPPQPRPAPIDRSSDDSASTTRPPKRIQAHRTRREDNSSYRRPDEPAAARDSEAGGRTIRITIGRVEIRAVSRQSKQQPPRPAPGPPVLSLEDYLKERKARLK
jgi:hypothetical protein